MDTIYKRTLQVKEMFCNCLVRSKHKVLDELGCSISLMRDYIDRISLFIQNNLGLWKIKVNCALGFSFLSKDT